MAQCPVPTSALPGRNTDGFMGLGDNVGLPEQRHGKHAQKWPMPRTVIILCGLA